MTSSPKTERFTVFVENLPSQVYLNGIMVRNIANIRLKTRKEKLNLKHGSPDVEVSYITGEKEVIYRSNLLDSFRELDGKKKLNIRKLRDGRKKLVTIPMKASVKVFTIPNTGKIVFAKKNGNKAVRIKPGNKVVNNGNRYLVIAPDTFRKMFIVTEKMNKDKLNSLKSSLEEQFRGQIKNQKAEDKYEEASRINRENIRNNDIAVVKGKAQVIQRDTKEEIIKADADSRYFITHQVKAFGEINQVIGYIVSNGKQSRALATPDVMGLCNRKMIRNMSLVRTQSGKFILRGNGMEKDTLQRAYGKLHKNNGKYYITICNA